jgi:RNA polymerase sigma-70 factor (ECF subfamily)
LVAAADAESRFRRLFDEHHRAVLAYFLRRTDRDSAYDCTEDVFATAWRKLDEIPDGDRTLPWLYGVSWRVLANHRRRVAGRRRLIDRLRAQPERSVVDPERQVVRRAEEADLLAAIGALAPIDREVLGLALWEELPHAEIGEILGCSTGAVDMRLHRAIRRLRKGIASSRHTTTGGPVLLPGEE